jgi:hypothetical protein
MYYSLNNEKKPIKAKILPDSVLGTYMQPRLVGRKIMLKTFHNPPDNSKKTNQTEIKPYKFKETPLQTIMGRITSNNTRVEENNLATIDYDSPNCSPRISSFPLNYCLPMIKPTADFPKLSTIDRDYIKPEESLLTRYKLQKTNMKIQYTNMVRNSLNSLTIAKHNNYKPKLSSL